MSSLASFAALDSQYEATCACTHWRATCATWAGIQVLIEHHMRHCGKKITYGALG